MTDQPGPIKVLLIGSCEGIDVLRLELETGHDALRLLHPDDTVTAGGEPGDALLAEADVVLVAADHPGESLPGLIDSLHRRTHVPIVLVTSSESARMLDLAASHAIYDIIALPQPLEHLAFTVRRAHLLGRTRSGQDRAARRAGHGSGAHVVTVYSPKGGAGRTTIAVNLAVAFAQHLHRRTLLVDFDLEGSDTALLLGLSPAKTLHDLALAIGDIDGPKLGGFVTRHTSGLHLLAGPGNHGDAESVKPDRLLDVLDAARDEYDVIVIDTSASYRPSLLAALDRTDDLLVVVAPDVATIRHDITGLTELERLSFPGDRVHAVMNRATLDSGLRSRDIERALGHAIAFRIPEDRALTVGENRGVPVVAEDPRSQAGQAFLRMCAAFEPEGAGRVLALTHRHWFGSARNGERPAAGAGAGRRGG